MWLAPWGVLVLLFGGGSALAETHGPESQDALSSINELCPVTTDEPIDLEIHTVHEGRTIYFCCKKCAKQFKADPAAFVGNLPDLALPEVTQEPGGGEEEHGEHEHAEDDPVTGAAETPPGAEEHDHGDHGGGLVRWVGRLHPMVVHFPIGLLLMAALAEFLLISTKGMRFAFAARFCLWGGALGALAAAPLGWANALGIDNDPDSFSAKLLFFHRWTGVVTAVVAAIALFACERSWRAGGESWMRPYRIALFLCALLVTVAGHLGASLVYGWSYLSWG